MKRREFIALIGGAAAWPVAVRAQQTDRVRLIGELIGFADGDPIGQALLASFRGGLTKLGWVEGKNLRIESRWGDADPDRIRSLAKELVGLRPDAIFCMPTLAASGLAPETRTIPIVFAVVGDPIGSGLVTSYVRPGGNITGFASFDPAISGKWVQILKEIAPRTERVVLLFNPTTAMVFQFLVPGFEAAVSSSGVQVSESPVHEKDEIEKVLAAQARTPGGGLIVMPDVFNVKNRDLIIALAARYSIPAIYFNPAFFVRSGGLIGYNDDYFEEARLAAGYIDRIIRGGNIADLPVQAPTKYQLMINLKTAKALGLTVPDKLIALADEVIE
jgi:putative tryptophan/tyrosine transport system substrate-binding protein